MRETMGRMQTGPPPRMRWRRPCRPRMPRKSPRLFISGFFSLHTVSTERSRLSAPGRGYPPAYAHLFHRSPTVSQEPPALAAGRPLSADDFHANKCRYGIPGLRQLAAGCLTSRILGRALSGNSRGFGLVNSRPGPQFAGAFCHTGLMFPAASCRHVGDNRPVVRAPDPSALAGAGIDWYRTRVEET